MGLVDSVVLWLKTPQGDVLKLVVRGSLLEGDGIEVVVAPALPVDKVVGVFIRPQLCSFHSLVCHPQGLARAAVELLT